MPAVLPVPTPTDEDIIMAKKPASPKATPKSVGKVAPPELVGADVGGESPQKASPVPEDAEMSFSYTEPQADGGETPQVETGRANNRTQVTNAHHETRHQLET